MSATAKGAAWLAATRPRTLVASLSPVAIGVGLAYRDIGEVSEVLVGLCLAFALFMQVGANFANDYYDHAHGADDDRQLGPARAVASGIISSHTMRVGSYLTLAFGFVLGLLLMKLSGIGWPLLVVGGASVVCALGYTAGPFPFAYIGLGDLFVVLFFGFLATGVTHYVLVTQVGCEWTPQWWVGLAVGLVINNLLVVNNYRDAEEDTVCGKRTLVVRFGRRFGLGLYLCGSCVALIICPWLEPSLAWTVWLLPMAFFLAFRLHQAKNQGDYAILFTGSAFLILAHGILTVAGLLH